MRFIDLFAGIGGFRLGFEQAGHVAVASSEVDPSANKVRSAQWAADNLGDITALKPQEIPDADIWTLGFPCQDVSQAGQRAGLSGARSGLVWTVLDLAAQRRPRWLLMENVPGLLSVDGGRGFGTLLARLGELGYGWAWRVLDAQHFGVAQRRRRVFILACLDPGTGWQRAAEVLLEPEGVQWDPPARGAARPDIAKPLASCSQGGSGWRSNGCEETFVIAAPPLAATLTSGRSSPGVNPPGRRQEDDINLVAGIIPFNAAQVTSRLNRSRCGPGEPSHTLAASGEPESVAASDGAWVRRLTPLECERLQGFPDGWTDVGLSDAARYRCLGNAVAVPVVEWIGRRLTRATLASCQPPSANGTTSSG